MIIHKFGGTSIGNPDRFIKVSEIIFDHHDRQKSNSSGGTVVVVSAMSGVTDQLIRAARAAERGEDRVYRKIKASLLGRHLEVVENVLEPGSNRLEIGGFIEDKFNELDRFLRSIALLGELTPRGRDLVSSFGEVLSSSILSALLRQNRVPSQPVIATEIIITDDHFGEASLLYPQSREKIRSTLSPLMDRGVVPVVTGYMGATEQGITTTLGRGGSDFSAAIIGAALDASEVCIWSDVDGILTADPNIVSQARTLEQLSYQEAADIAYYGADVLHPKTIRPVIENNIPLRILNSFNPSHPGTLITKKPMDGREIYPAIISTGGLSLIAIRSSKDNWSLAVAAKILQTLHDEGQDVLMFSQSFSENSINLIVRMQDQSHALRVLKNAFYDSDRSHFLKMSQGCDIDARDQIGIISVVSLTPNKTDGLLSHAYGALGKAGTEIIAVAQPATEQSVSFCIPEEKIGETVCMLHTELGLDENR